MNRELAYIRVDLHNNEQRAEDTQTKIFIYDSFMSDSEKSLKNPSSSDEHDTE
jgi:hypothetical protein